MSSTTFYAMGSRIQITFEQDGPEGDAALRRARIWTRGCELRLSRFLAESELSQLNRQAGQTVRASGVLRAVLGAALKGARRTCGLVTPTILDALEQAGYDRSFEQIPAGGLGGERKASRSGAQAWRSIELDRKAETVRLPEGVRIDLGGFAKGWAADQLRRRLGKIAAVVVDAGGDIAVGGPRRDGSAWRIAIGNPENPGEDLAVLGLRQGGVATSGRTQRQWRQGEKQQHHLIDPRSGEPALTDVLSASVVGPNALEAEIAAKAVLILGSQAGLAWLERFSRLAGLVVRDDGRVLYSRRFQTLGV